MTKLKTFKDCKDLAEVRRAAIKWVKHLIKESAKGRLKGFAIMDAFAEFFNLTEEDLK